jgi:hypothetical protein
MASVTVCLSVSLTLCTAAGALAGAGGGAQQRDPGTGGPAGGAGSGPHLPTAGEPVGEQGRGVVLPWCAWSGQAGRTSLKPTRMHLVLFGMQNRTLRPYLAAIYTTLISLVGPRGAQQACMKNGFQLLEDVSPLLAFPF